MTSPQRTPPTPLATATTTARRSPPPHPHWGLKNILRMYVKKVNCSEWEQVSLPSSVRSMVALNLNNYESGRNPWGNLKPEYLEKTGFVGAHVNDGLLEIFGLKQGWQASFVLSDLISAKHIAQEQPLANVNNRTQMKTKHRCGSKSISVRVLQKPKTGLARNRMKFGGSIENVDLRRILDDAACMDIQFLDQMDMQGNADAKNGPGTESREIWRVNENAILRRMHDDTASMAI
ncbi:hypothetical protein TEA_026272 [Camellia sinensis var. sinensis]|uniref:Diacylglycerol kinase accessory domain-containing protein n=1 Tax=Camellia sinensis var. sinensis TaxID=542762 RepID=A0A4S4ESH5_CAMSN|nr:hypothetical protein TEA_026272 [Camellia sinensis var. sinensis]